MSEWNQERGLGEQPKIEQNSPGQPGFQGKPIAQPPYSMPPTGPAGEKPYTDSADTARKKPSGPPPYSIQAPEGYGYQPPYQPPQQPYAQEPPRPQQPVVGRPGQPYTQGPGQAQTYTPQNPPYTQGQPYGQNPPPYTAGQQPYQGQLQQPPYGYVYQKPARPGKGMGTAALVLGILSLVFVISLWFSVTMAVIAISLGAASWVKGRCGTGLAGIIMGIVAIVLVILILGLGLSLFNALMDDSWSYDYDYLGDGIVQPVSAALALEGQTNLASYVAFP